jgi:hypothetical protein
MKAGLLAAAALVLASPSFARPASADFDAAVRDAASAIESAEAGLTARPSQAGPAASDDPRCRPETDADPKIYTGDFHWGYTLPELLQRFPEMYAAPKRLPRRAFWNAAEKRFELPYLADNGGNVALPQSFIQAVAHHIEDAGKADVVDAVFFPDMGHSHFLIPEKRWKEKYDAYPVSRFSRLYEDLFRDPALEVLYHTAEQLKTRNEDGSMVDDARTKRRYETRNIVGRNDGTRGLRVLVNPQSAANTVSDVPGYFWWGAGFNISADENGCFSAELKGRIVRFDLSLYDLEPAPGEGVSAQSSFAGAARPAPRFGECESLARERKAR